MTQAVRMTPTLFEAQGGDFASNKRYIRNVPSGGFAMAGGRTIAIAWTGTVGGFTYNRATFRWSVVVHDVYAIVVDTSPSVITDPGAPGAPIVQVTI